MDINNNGSVKISEEVIAKIAETSACEVEGVYKILPKVGAPKNAKNKGVSIVSAEDGLDVFLQIALFQGYKIGEVSKNVQSHVAESISTMTGFNVKSVNITVTAISSK